MKETQSATTIAREIVDNVSKVIVGKQPVIKQALAAVIAKGHILIEDVPGVGKTMLAKSISSSIGCSFKRIQFTPAQRHRGRLNLQPEHQRIPVQARSGHGPDRAG